MKQGKALTHLALRLAGHKASTYLSPNCSLKAAWTDQRPFDWLKFLWGNNWDWDTCSLYGQPAVMLDVGLDGFVTGLCCWLPGRCIIHVDPAAQWTPFTWLRLLTPPSIVPCSHCLRFGLMTSRIVLGFFGGSSTSPIIGKNGILSLYVSILNVRNSFITTK